MNLQELPVDVLSRNEYLVAHFRMAGHYPHVLALADHAFRWAAKKDSEDLMVYVLEHGAPLDFNALLHSTEVNGNPEALALLEAKSATTNPLHSFTNILHTACFYGQIDFVIDLLYEVPSITTVKMVLCCKDHRGETALHKAVGGCGEKKEIDRQNLVEMLLSLGADPTERDSKGTTALYFAEIWRSDEMITTLRVAINRRLQSPPTPEEVVSGVGAMETPADTIQSLSTDDEVSSLKFWKSSSRDKTGNRLAHKAEKVGEHKLSWWRSLLMPEVKRRHQAVAEPPMAPHGDDDMVFGPLDPLVRL